MALYNPSSGAWTDMIWAGGNLLGEVVGSQAPEYRLLDHEGSVVATTDGSGNVTGSDLLTPYGQAASNSTYDPYLYTGLDQDAINGSDHAWYRNYSVAQSRWLRPDPYNGSYDLLNPQSLNRYNYVENNPLMFTDPSGLAGGVTGWSGPCKIANDATQNSISNSMTISPCNPVSYMIAYGITHSALDVVPNFIADDIDQGLNSMFGTSLSTNVTASVAQVAGYVTAAFTIACSIDNFNSAMCGPSGWTSVAFGGNSKVGKGVNDAIALTGAIICGIDPGGPACLGYAIYSVANAAFSWMWSEFSGPQFTGSLLPRPADLQGLGTSPIGIPNRNLSIKDILGQPSSGAIPTPAQ